MALYQSTPCLSQWLLYTNCDTSKWLCTNVLHASPQCTAYLQPLIVVQNIHWIWLYLNQEELVCLWQILGTSLIASYLTMKTLQMFMQSVTKGSFWKVTVTLFWVCIIKYKHQHVKEKECGGLSQVFALWLGLTNIFNGQSFIVIPVIFLLDPLLFVLFDPFPVHLKVDRHNMSLPKISHAGG